MEAHTGARLCFNVALLAKLWFTGVALVARPFTRNQRFGGPPPPRQVTAYSRQRYGLSHTTGRSVAEHRIERGAGVPRSQSEFYSEKLLVRRRHFGGRP